MQTDDSGEDTKVFLNQDELERLIDKMREKDWERAIAGLLMGKVGCRVEGVKGDTPAKYANIRDSGEGYQEIDITSKNTRGNGQSTRQAFIPEEVAKEIEMYAKERNIAPAEPLVSAANSSIRRWVYEAAAELAEETGDDRWTNVSSHDLRRSWAHYHLVENDRSPRVMMAIGGWSSYDAIEPYMSQPSKSKIAEEMGET